MKYMMICSRILNYIIYAQCLFPILSKNFFASGIVVIFGLYADESFAFVDKQTMDSQVLAAEGCVPPALLALFKNVSYGSLRLTVSYLDCNAYTKESMVGINIIIKRLNSHQTRP